MIHRIEIENFYSIRERQVLDLRIPKTTPDDRRFPPSSSDPEVRLPTVVAFYGANASGKSTVLRAYTSAIWFAARSFDDLGADAAVTGFAPFQSAAELAKPTRIAVEFDAAWVDDRQRRHRYELEFINNGPGHPRAVGREALRFAPEKKFVRIFERRGREVLPGKVLGLRRDDPRLSVRDNASVIATLAKFGHPLASRIAGELNATQTNYLHYGRRRVDEKVLFRMLVERPEVLDDLNRQLRRIDVGLDLMEIQQGMDGPVALFRHKGLDGWIPYEIESTGTRTFIEHWPMLRYALQNGQPAFFDELDADLHALLLPEILRWFHDTRPDKHGNPGDNAHRAQLFLTSHNPTLLDDLQKEEVFFTEKDHTGATGIYGARDFAGLRRDMVLSRKYLGGVLGAVPSVG